MNKHWPSALRELVARELSDVITSYRLSVVVPPIISPSPDSAAHIFGTVEIHGPVSVAQFHIETIDALSDCAFVRGDVKLCDVSAQTEKVVPEGILIRILSKIENHYGYDYYGVLLARAVLHCDIIAARLSRAFIDRDFRGKSEISRPGLLEEKRIARWL